MAINLNRGQLAETVWRIANKGMSPGQTGLSISDIGAMINPAVSDLCRELAAINSPLIKSGVIKSEGWYYLQKVTNPSYASGGLWTLDSNILAESIRDSKRGQVLHDAFTKPLTYKMNPADLYYRQPGKATIGMYAVIGGNSTGGILHIRNGVPADITTGTVTVRACAMQTFDTLAAELEEDLINVMVDMARRKMSGA